MIDSARLHRTLADLVRIDSINPSLVPGAAGEAEIAAYVAGDLEDAGLEVHLHEPEPGRVSAVGVLEGSNSMSAPAARRRGRSLMLNAHVDTVGVEGMAEPFSGRIEGSRLHGRGAYDMKGSLAACLAAARALAEASRGIRAPRNTAPPLAGDLVIAAVADEEHASLGTADLLGRYPVDGAIVTEPSELAISRAHKGFVWIEVVTRGRAAHGSRYDLGVDANLRMGRVLHALAALEAELRSRPPHELVGPPSLHAATLAGGTGLSTYAESSTLEIERRTVPGETAAQVEAEIAALLDRLRAEDPGFEAEQKTLLVREPFEVAAGSDIVRALEAASAEVLGEAPPHRGEHPWMDSALLAGAGVETVVMGPCGAGAHAAEEWVVLESVERFAEILVGTARRWCGTGDPRSG